MPLEEKKKRWRERRKLMRRLARRLRSELQFQWECGIKDPTLAAVARRIAR